MAANKTSAIADQEPVDILFALQPGFNMLDFAGPLAAFYKAQHDPADSCMYSGPSLGCQPHWCRTQC